MNITDWTRALAAQLHTINNKSHASHEEMLQAATVAGSVIVCMANELSTIDLQAILAANALPSKLAQQYANFFLENARTIVYSHS